MAERKSCKDCVYFRSYGNGAPKFCHYMIDTGQRRGCPASKCDKKIVAKKRRTRIERIHTQA